MSITLIAVTDMNMGIGDNEGNLLFKLPKDMKHFRNITAGKLVVMGRKTWDSLPKKPLEKRKNCVLTRDTSFNPIGVKVLHSVEDTLKLSSIHDICVIGGGEIYEQFLPYANKLIITHVHTTNNNATVFFPDFNYEQWELKSKFKHEADENHEHSFTFATYERK